MRILIGTGPAFGHLNPMLPLARAAEQAGHEVVVATGAEMVPQVQRHGFTCWQVGLSRAENDAAFRARHPDLDAYPAEERMRLAIDGMFVAGSARRAADLVPRAEEWKPDIVVHEPSELASAIAAARTGARHVVHGLGFPPPAQLWAAFNSGFGRMCADWDVPELATGIRSATYLDVWPVSLRPHGEPTFTRVRPLRPAVGEPLVGERLPWSEDVLGALPHERTAHLTLGTIFFESTGVLDAAIAGLRELPVNLVVTCGPGTDPARFGPQPPHVLIEPYVPHTLLLPRCDLVVSHGGAGILLGALANGLPQLVLPQGADQFINGDAIAASGAGLTVLPDDCSAEAVAGAVERLLSEPAFAAAAAGIRAEIDAMPTAPAVVDVVAAASDHQAG